MPSIHGWLPPSHKIEFVVVRSQIYELPLHYIDGVGSARCIRAGCELCSALGEPKEHHCCVVSKSKAQGFWLLEFTHAHEDLVEYLQNLHGELVGQELRVRRRASTQDPLVIERSDTCFPCSIVSVPHYVRAIGMRQYYAALAMLPIISA